jgi:hypothetical protein
MASCCSGSRAGQVASTNKSATRRHLRRPTTLTSTSSRSRNVVVSRALSSSHPSPPPAAARLEGEQLEKLKAVMAEDLSHLFDETGIDKSLYEADVSFEDPLTKVRRVPGCSVVGS